MEDERLPLGKYWIAKPEWVKGLMKNNRDFYYDPKFEDLHHQVDVVEYDDDGDHVSYTADGKRYSMDLYSFERIYTKMEDAAVGKLSRLENGATLNGAEGSIPSSSACKRLN